MLYFGFFFQLNIKNITQQNNNHTRIEHGKEKVNEKRERKIDYYWNSFQFNSNKVHAL